MYKNLNIFYKIFYKKGINRVSGFLQILRSLGPVRLTIIGSVMVGVALFFGYLMTQSSQGNQTLLFSNLDPSEGAKIIHKIEMMDIPVTLNPDGTAIYVPAEKVARLRMELAEDGLPNGGSVGYEIFDRGDVLSTTGSLVDINRLRAMEGELSKSIRTISGVSAARVHLVLPKRELFSKDKIDSSASVVLKMKGVNKLTATQVQAVQNLVASAVPGLPVDRVSIIDDKGNLLAKNKDGDNIAQGLTSQQEAKRAYESSTSKQIETLLERSVGYGKVKVEVSADIDFDVRTVNSEKYDPEGQVIRNVGNTQETSSSEGGQNVAAGVQNALPDEANNTSGGEKNSTKRNEENTTYEISRTIETHKKEAGNIKALSVAVLVDGTSTKDKDGKITYTPRSKEDIDQIKLLVKTAIGFNEKRGDQVEIVNMQFNKPELEETAEEAPSNSLIPEMDITRLIELLVLSAVGILILIMIVRPVLLRVIENSDVSNMDPEAAALLATARGQQPVSGIPDFSTAVISGSSSSFPSMPPSDFVMPADEEEGDMLLDITNVDGRVKASSLKKISDIIDKHPEEAVTIIRNWMYDEPWKQEKSI